MFDGAEDLLLAARRIHKAGNVEAIATELVRLVCLDTPRDSREWRERRVIHAAVRSELEHLKLAWAQHHAGSAEQAQEFRRVVSRSLHDMLASALPPSRRDDLREGLDHISEAAVTAVVGQRRGSDELRAAAMKYADGPAAYAALNGSLFIPARAREFARRFGIEESRLTNVIAEAAQPLRAACRASGVCRVGQLRHSMRVPGCDLLLRASLDPSTDDPSDLAIRIRLIDAAAGLNESPTGERYNFGDALETYSARLMRRLVS